MNVTASRLKELRKNRKLTLKEVSEQTSINVSTISNYENGYSIPKKDKLKQLANFYSVSESYIMGYSEYEHGSEERLSQDLGSDISELNEKENDIAEYQENIKKLKNEYSNSSFDTIEGTYLASLLGESIDTRVTLEELYENVLEEMSKDLHVLFLERDMLSKSVEEKNFMINKLKNQEIFSIKDRLNPDFEKHGISQIKVSENLKSLPFILNYENTMKVVEYANLLAEKEENRFNPTQR